MCNKMFQLGVTNKTSFMDWFNQFIQGEIIKASGKTPLAIG